MKKIFEVPEIRVVSLSKEDIVTASTVTGKPSGSGKEFQW